MQIAQVVDKQFRDSVREAVRTENAIRSQGTWIKPGWTQSFHWAVLKVFTVLFLLATPVFILSAGLIEYIRWDASTISFWLDGPILCTTTSAVVGGLICLIFGPRFCQHRQRLSELYPREDDSLIRFSRFRTRYGLLLGVVTSLLVYFAINYKLAWFPDGWIWPVVFATVNSILLVSISLWLVGKWPPGEDTSPGMLLGCLFMAGCFAVCSFFTTEPMMRFHAGQHEGIFTFLAPSSWAFALLYFAGSMNEPAGWTFLLPVGFVAWKGQQGYRRLQTLTPAGYRDDNHRKLNDSFDNSIVYHQNQKSSRIGRVSEPYTVSNQHTTCSTAAAIANRIDELSRDPQNRREFMAARINNRWQFYLEPGPLRIKVNSNLPKQLDWFLIFIVGTLFVMLAIYWILICFRDPASSESYMAAALACSGIMMLPWLGSISEVIPTGAYHLYPFSYFCVARASLSRWMWAMLATSPLFLAAVITFCWFFRLEWYGSLVFVLRPIVFSICLVLLMTFCKFERQGRSKTWRIWFLGWTTVVLFVLMICAALMHSPHYLKFFPSPCVPCLLVFAGASLAVFFGYGLAYRYAKLDFDIDVAGTDRC